MLFVVGAIHVRLRSVERPEGNDRAISETAFLQAPSWCAVGWRVRAVVRQLLLQAMPIFLLICVIGALLDLTGILDRVAASVAPLMAVFRLPGEVAPGLIFSIIRKDGLLVLNTGDGAILRGLSPAQALVTVYLASTLTACLVTLWTVGKEISPKFALHLASRQALTSIVSALVIAWIAT